MHILGVFLCKSRGILVSSCRLQSQNVESCICCESDKPPDKGSNPANKACDSHVMYRMAAVRVGFFLLNNSETKVSCWRPPDFCSKVPVKKSQ